MTLKITLTALTFIAAPLVAFAQCSGSHGSEQAQSCISGTAWDQDSGACVPNTIG